jgi:hypothetical protein
MWTPALQGSNGGGGSITLTNSAPVTVNPQTAAIAGLVVKGAASQTANLQEWQNSAGTVLASINSSGDITTSAAIFAGTSTWFTATANIRPLNANVIGAVIRGAASQTANLQEWQNSAGTIQASIDSSGQLRSPAILNNNSFNNSRIRVLDAGLTIDTGVAANVALTVTNTNALPTGDLFRANGTVGSLQITSSGGVRSAINVANSFGGGTSANNILAVRANVATNVPLIVSGAASQTANLQEWQNSAGTVLARMTSAGVLRASQVLSLNGLSSMGEFNNGAIFEFVRATAASYSPGANRATIYFRDGTNAGTLKLVVRAGAAGAETTILDNIPQ